MIIAEARDRGSPCCSSTTVHLCSVNTSHMLSGPHVLLTPIIPIIVLTFHQWADERKDAVDVPSLSLTSLIEVRPVPASSWQPLRFIDIF